MASAASRRIVAQPQSYRVIFNPERNLSLSESGLKAKGSNERAFRCDPIVERFTDARVGFSVKLAGYPQEAELHQNYMLPTLWIVSAKEEPAFEVFVRLALVVTAKANCGNVFCTHKIMTTLPMARRDATMLLYDADNVGYSYSPLPEYDSVSIQKLRTGEIASEDEQEKKLPEAAKKRAKTTVDMAAIWAPRDPASIAIQVMRVPFNAPALDLDSEWNHPNVIFTMVVQHERKKTAKRAKKEKKSNSEESEEKQTEAVEKEVEELLASLPAAK